MSEKCKNCDKFIRKRTGFKKVIKTEEEAQVYRVYLNNKIFVNDVICNTCRLMYYKKKKASISEASSPLIHFEESNESPEGEALALERSDEECLSLQDSDTNDDSDFISKSRPSQDFVEVPFQRVVATHKYCIICNSTQNIHRISRETRIEVFVRKQIFIPNGDRCCETHLIGKKFYEDDLARLRIVSNTSKIEKTEVALFLKLLASKSQTSIFSSINESDMPENQVISLTGLCWDQIIDIRRLLTTMRETSTRSVIQALIVFLFKLRTGASNKIIATTFGIDYEQYVSDFSDQILNSFKKDILPYHFGCSSISRQELIDNCSPIAKKLLNINENQVILIADGTYIRHQKSKNNYYQRKSYSGQKKTHLCKPFTICTTNGFVVDFFGPFYGSQNDASIMKTVLEDPSGIIKLLRPNDIFVVDRGFRDVVNYLEQKNFIVLMPAFKGRRPQLSTEEANLSRKITKIRWVVEVVHGIIAQKYKLLHHTVDNKMLPKIGLLCKVAGYLHNKYGKRFYSDGELQNTIMEYMEQRMNKANTLIQEVSDQHLNRRKSKLQQLKATELLDFPRLSEKQLKILFMGSYQFSQAVSYLAELMDDQNNLLIRYVKETPNIINAEVKSRHIGRKVYRIYIDYSDGTDFNCIRRYCCDCPNGNRTIGCCSHVAAVIYYLSYGRYLSRILRPAEVLSKIFAVESVPVVINEDSDDD